MIFRCLLLALLLVFCADAFAGAGEPVVIGQAQRIHSSVLDEDRAYQVYLPASYAWAPDRRYPVYYVLDGSSHFAHTAGSVGYLAAHGEIPEMIVVAVASTVRVRDFTQTDWPSRWVGGGGAEHFKRFLSSELIPEIDRTYRTDGFRILSGHSAGGQFALYCLTVEPALFRAYFAFSPSLDWDDNLPRRSLQQSFASRQALPAFLYFASSDDSGPAQAENDRLVEALRTQSAPGFRWHSRAYPDETHGSVPLLAQIDALRALYAGYRFHNDRMQEGLPAAEKHFETLSKTLGWPIGIPEGVLNDLGYAALSKGDTDAAIAMFQRNAKSHPNSANAHDSLADGYAKQERWQDSARASDHALSLATRYHLPNRAAFQQQAKRRRERALAAP